MMFTHKRGQNEGFSRGITRLSLVYKRLQCIIGAKEGHLGACLRTKRGWPTILRYANNVATRLVGVNVKEVSNLVISKGSYIGLSGNVALIPIKNRGSKGKRW